MKIHLTSEEQAELRSRAYPPFGHLPTIARYWLGIYASRGIHAPHGKLPVCIALPDPGTFRLEWHPRALGPAAIAAGHSFRALHERKDKEFQEKLQQRGVYQ